MTKRQKAKLKKLHDNAYVLLVDFIAYDGFVWGKEAIRLKSTLYPATYDEETAMKVRKAQLFFSKHRDAMDWVFKPNILRRIDDILAAEISR